MDDIRALFFAWLAGGALGAFFFFGLWWTVKNGVSSKRPALLFSGSLLLRMGITIAGFFFVSAGRWQRLMMCLIGFAMARFVLLWRAKSHVKYMNQAS
jgi:F1F0 ATPase subunit 2